MVERKQKKDKTTSSPEEEDLGKGNLFATGLVAGGAIAGVLIAFISGTAGGEKLLGAINLEETLQTNLQQGGYFLGGAIFFAAMGIILYRVAVKKT